METVAVVGLGRMGNPMAGRLLVAGYDVVVWNRSPERAQALSDRGGVVASTPRDAANSADAVIIMVSDPHALDEVVDGPDGVSAGLADQTTVIQMATVGVEATMRIASMLEKDTFLDAPVLGSVGEAEAGTLAIFVGGPQTLIERWRPLLEVLGRTMIVGPVGAGSAAKLVANLTLFGTLGVLGEALKLGAGLGLSQDVMFDVLAATPLAAQAERRRPAIESGEYPPRFALSLAVKDVDLILDASRGADLRLTKAARSWLSDAALAGWSDRDYASLIAFIVG